MSVPLTQALGVNMTRQELVEIDIGDIMSSRALHSALASALNFPEWYGHNWDAFRDSITGLVEMPITLRVVGFDRLAARLPADAANLKQCLFEMTVEQPESASAIVYT